LLLKTALSSSHMEVIPLYLGEINSILY